MSGDYKSLYQREDPSTPDWPIPTHTNLFNIDDETSTNGDIEAAVRQMRRNREDKHKNLQAEHNQQWIREAYTTETSTAHTNSTWWIKFSKDNSIHVGDRVHTDGTGMDWAINDSKGKCGYLGYQADISSLEGDGGGDRNPD